MAFTQDDIDKLSAAIASGVQTVEFADKRITYNSISEMMRARQMMQSELATTNAGRVPVRVTRVQFSKGMD